jgi:predicted lipid-binding transport protein (Tim44 family)
MNENNKIPVVIRILGALGGLLGGAIIGMVFMAAIIPIAENASRFIWPVTIFCALIGMLLGFFIPKIAAAFLLFPFPKD